MSVRVNGMPISMWTDRAIMEELNMIVSTRGNHPALTVIAEAACRALAAVEMTQHRTPVPDRAAGSGENTEERQTTQK